MIIPILYEDADMLVIDKPSGLVVHPSTQLRASSDGKTDELTLVDWLLERYPGMKDVGEPIETTNQKTGEQVMIFRPGIVHRIDRETSGCLIVAKHQDAFLFLKSQFQNREVEKEYKAIVWGTVKQDAGTIDAPIGRSKSDFRRWTAMRGTRGALREAVTEYAVERRFEKEGNAFTYVSAFPETGRTHQIRVHFKYLNHPILCDALYAPKLPHALGIERLALHAFAIAFTAFGGERMRITAPLPEDFSRALS